jgi:excisionase family DNA binding protein
MSPQIENQGSDEGEDQGRDRALRTAEVAALFGVSPKTVIRWADSGKLVSWRTLGGHRRYSRAQVLAMLEGMH